MNSFLNLKFPAILLPLLLQGIWLYGQKTVTISGQIDHPKGDLVSVTYYENYITFDEAVAGEARLNKEGQFTMTLEWPDCMPATFHHGDEITEMYLCPGDQLRITLDTRQFDETVQYEGKGATVNNYLAAKFLRTESFGTDDFALSETLFIHRTDSMRDASLAFLEGQPFAALPDDRGPTAQFVTRERNNILYGWANTRMMYPMLSRALNPSLKDEPLSDDYNTYFKEVELYNPDALNCEEYIQFVTDYVERESMKSALHAGEQDQVKMREAYILENVPPKFHDLIFTQWIYNALSFDADMETATALYDKYESIFSPRHKKMLMEVMDKEAALAPGKPAPPFTLPDLNGNNVSLEDFRGKVIYLDIWASWCGPCIGEIPHAKKLQEELTGKDIVFLYVSIDDNPAAWKKMIRSKELEGVHLLSAGGFDSEIAKSYNVAGIPRYVLIDAEGNIADSNAPRPSMGAKKEILRLLPE